MKVADLPDLSLRGDITELGSRAEQVSAFPVVVRLENSVPGLNAGMSVEVSRRGAVDRRWQWISAAAQRACPGRRQGCCRVSPRVFVYDDASSTVKKRQITVGGIRDN